MAVRVHTTYTNIEAPAAFSFHSPTHTTITHIQRSSPQLGCLEHQHHTGSSTHHSSSHLIHRYRHLPPHLHHYLIDAEESSSSTVGGDDATVSSTADTASVHKLSTSSAGDHRMLLRGLPGNSYSGSTSARTLTAGGSAYSSRNSSPRNSIDHHSLSRSLLSAFGSAGGSRDSGGGGGSASRQKRKSSESASSGLSSLVSGAIAGIDRTLSSRSTGSSSAVGEARQKTPKSAQKHLFRSSGASGKADAGCSGGGGGGSGQSSSLKSNASSGGVLTPRTESRSTANLPGAVVEQGQQRARSGTIGQYHHSRTHSHTFIHTCKYRQLASSLSVIFFSHSLPRDFSHFSYLLSLSGVASWDLFYHKLRPNLPLCLCQTVYT